MAVLLLNWLELAMYVLLPYEVIISAFYRSPDFICLFLFLATYFS